MYQYELVGLKEGAHETQDREQSGVAIILCLRLKLILICRYRGRAAYSLQQALDIVVQMFLLSIIRRGGRSTSSPIIWATNFIIV